MRILYGGSVKPDNIRALMAEEDVDGGLVGGASLSAESFIRIVQEGKGGLAAMITFLTVVHVIVCVFLILVVLLQAGKGGGMGIAFGGAGSQTVFGSSGAGNFLTRLTSITAVIFLVTSLALAHYSSQQDSKRLQRLAEQKAVEKKADDEKAAKLKAELEKARRRQGHADCAARRPPAAGSAGGRDERAGDRAAPAPPTPRPRTEKADAKAKARRPKAPGGRPGGTAARRRRRRRRRRPQKVDARRRRARGPAGCSAAAGRR